MCACAEIDRAFKQFVFESMDLTTTDSNGFLLTREAEGLHESSIPWDDPYPFFMGMVPSEAKFSEIHLKETGCDEDGSGRISIFICFVTPFFRLYVIACDYFKVHLCAFLAGEYFSYYLHNEWHR